MTETRAVYEAGMTGEPLRALQEQLEAPFPPEAHEFKPQSMSRDRKRALGVPYVDPRYYQERLDEVDPSWSSTIDIQLLDDRVFLVSTVTVLGRSRSATGESMLRSTTRNGEINDEENALTSAEAQAFKRACTAHGLGRYIYLMPKWWADYDDGSRRFTEEAENELRSKVAAATGQAFTPAKTSATQKPRQAASGGNGTTSAAKGNGNGGSKAPVENQASGGSVGPTDFWTAASAQIGTGKRFTDRNAALAFLKQYERGGSTAWAEAVAALRN